MIRLFTLVCAVSEFITLVALVHGFVLLDIRVVAGDNAREDFDSSLRELGGLIFCFYSDLYHVSFRYYMQFINFDTVPFFDFRFEVGGVSFEEVLVDTSGKDRSGRYLFRGLDKLEPEAF